MSAENWVTISQLSFARGDKSIFQNISINIARGKITAIMGPSGTGKTTLLKLIGAELYPDSGHIFVDGIDIHQLKRKPLYNERKKMGILFQTGALFSNLSVFDNVAFPLYEHTRLPKALIRDIVLMKLQAVGLRGAQHLMPQALSGGMARRVALARAIVLDPELMLYDEPFTGQDPISMGVLVRLIKQLNKLLGMTSVVVSHDVTETLAIADYVYILSDGHVIGEGEPVTLMASEQADVRQFIDGLADGAVPFHYPAKDYAEDLMNV